MTKRKLSQGRQPQTHELLELLQNAGAECALNDTVDVGRQSEQRRCVVRRDRRNQARVVAVQCRRRKHCAAEREIVGGEEGLSSERERERERQRKKRERERDRERRGDSGEREEREDENVQRE